MISFKKFLILKETRRLNQDQLIYDMEPEDRQRLRTLTPDQHDEFYKGVAEKQGVEYVPKTVKIPSDTTLGAGTSGFKHSDFVGADLATAVLGRQRKSGQVNPDFPDEITHITPHAPTAPHQRQLDLGQHGARKPFILHPDDAAPRSEADTVRFGFATKNSSTNNNTHGIKDDGYIRTTIWDSASNSWKEKTHELEYGQGRKQWIRRYKTIGGIPHEETSEMQLKGDALKKLQDLPRATTLGAVKARWGPELTAKLISPDTHFLNRDHTTGSFSVVRIGDLHDDTPISLSFAKRSAEHDRAASEDNSIKFNMGKVMRHQQANGIGGHALNADQVLDYFQELHRRELAAPKQEIKEWIYSHLISRGINLS